MAVIVTVTGVSQLLLLKVNAAGETVARAVSPLVAVTVTATPGSGAAANHTW